MDVSIDGEAAGRLVIEVLNITLIVQNEDCLRDKLSYLPFIVK